MRDDIIKRKLKEVGISYKETTKHFLVPKEKIMNQDKAPKWFQDFEKRNDSRWDKNDKRLDNIDKRLENIENTPTMQKELNSK